MLHTNIPRSSRFVDRREIPLERARGRRVLHIGIGGSTEADSEIAARFRNSDLEESLHGRLSRVATELTGLDIDATTITAMRAKVPGRYVVGDVADPDLPKIVGSRFDTVLFLEVLQDVGNPRQALLNVKNMLVDDGELVLSTCNAYCLDRFAKLLFGYESVYPEHICYFSYVTIKRLLHVTGFEIDSAYYTFMPRDGNGRFMGKIVYPIEQALCRMLPQFGEGVLVVARPRP